MKELLIALPKGNQPKYRWLADSLRTAIREGHLKPSDILPSSRDLARRFHLNRHTVMNALAELVAEGWIEAKEKVHYQVVKTLPSTFLRPPAYSVNAIAKHLTDLNLKISGKPIVLTEPEKPVAEQTA